MRTRLALIVIVALTVSLGALVGSGRFAALTRWTGVTVKDPETSSSAHDVLRKTLDSLNVRLIELEKRGGTGGGADR